MQEKLVSYKVAKLAKKKEFKEKVYALYKIPTERGKYKEGNLVYTSSSYDPESFTELIYDYNSLKSYSYEDKEYISAPTQNLLQKWLREIHKINVHMYSVHTLTFNDEHQILWGFDIYNLNNGLKEDNEYCLYSQQAATRRKLLFKKNYEEILEKGLYKALLLINTKVE